MAGAFVHHVRVRFSETDAMGVVHHGAYPLYLETARVELLRAAGHPYHRLRAEGIDLAVVDLAIRYHRPLTFDDDVRVAVTVTEASRASFTLDYDLSVGGHRCATARTRHAAVDTDGRPRRLPRWIADLAGDPGATPSGPSGPTLAGPGTPTGPGAPASPGAPAGCRTPAGPGTPTAIGVHDAAHGAAHAGSTGPLDPVDSEASQD